MRKRYRVLVFAALAAALIVPLGYALSIDSRPKAPRTRYALAAPATTGVVAPRVSAVGVSKFFTASDSTQLLCIGTVLFGLAAAVRRAI